MTSHTPTGLEPRSKPRSKPSSIIDDIKGAYKFLTDPNNPPDLWSRAFETLPESLEKTSEQRFNDAVQTYLSEGKTPEEARDLADDLIGGAASAGLMAGGLAGGIIGEAIGGPLGEALLEAPPPAGPFTAVESEGIAPGNIRDDPGAFLERGVYGQTSDVTYLVRTEGINQNPGTYGVHLFNSNTEATAFAEELAAKGQQFIRNDLALPPNWNGVELVRVYEVPEGTQYIQGVVGEQTTSGVTYFGGGPQVVIDKTVRITRVGDPYPVNKP